ncbi:MAG: AsmA family protein [Robiginitomaculum sp.]|nr:AsmA family protein [Robiginitomaculum sp.]
MKRIIGFLLILPIVAIGALIIAFLLVPTETYKQTIEQQASATLDRQVTITGPVKLHIFPSISASATQVTIANPPGFSGENFAHIGQLRVGVKLLPLFSKKVEITEFILERPQISLEKNKHGIANWIIGSQQSAKKSKNGFVREKGNNNFQAQLGDVRIIDGTASYIDQSTRKKTSIEKINLTLKLPGMNKKMNLSASLELDGKPFSLTAELSSLGGFLQGNQTPFSLTAGGELINFTFDGEFSEAKEIRFSGDMDLNIPSLQKLMQVNGNQINFRPDTFGTFAINGKVKGAMDILSFTSANLVFDQIIGSGNFSAIFTGKKPELIGDLQINTLDLNPYLPPVPPPGTKIESWSKQSLELGVLKAANASFNLSVASLKARNIEFTTTNVTTKLVNGRLEAIISDSQLYGGTNTGVLVVNTRRNTPSFSFKSQIKDVSALPLLTAAAGIENIEGTGELQLDIKGVGKSIDAIMRSLSGNANMQVRDGAIRGVNLASVLRNAQSYLLTGALSAEAGQTAKTDFSSLKGSFVISKGVARNTDMFMTGPLVRVNGQGQIDLGRQTIDYRMTPKAVASLKGQGGGNQLQGISVPFLVQGPWNDIKAGLDTAALQQAALNRAKREAGRLIQDNVGGELGGLLQGFLGGQEAQTASGTETNADTAPREKTDEEKALGILGGLLGFGGSEKPPAKDDE